ncbi:MAG TPA: hypothetical protein IAB56_00475 [Candidatus Scybalousia intestinigallinarum]|nr:hypothetical protein [Candidatus Scybalousia intestinigallinarum]
MRESMMIIVPEETETFKDFHRTLDSDCSRHGLAIFEFCRQNSIFFPQFQELVQEENYNGYVWSRFIAQLGYVAIQETLTHKVFYLPPVLTDHQYAWLKRYKSYFKRCQEMICFYSYSDLKDGFQEDLYDETTIPDENCLALLYDLIKEKHVHSKPLVKSLS